MYEGAPPAPASERDVIGAAIAAALKREHENRSVEVWPENWPAFQVFARVATQWRVGMNGPSGLCYEAVYPLLDRMDLCADDWDEMLDHVQVMERAALAAMRGEEQPQEDTE